MNTLGQCGVRNKTENSQIHTNTCKTISNTFTLLDVNHTNSSYKQLRTLACLKESYYPLPYTGTLNLTHDTHIHNLTQWKHFHSSNYSPDTLPNATWLHCFLQAGFLPASGSARALRLGVRFLHDGLCLVLVDGLAMLLHQVILLPGFGHLLGTSDLALWQLQVLDAFQVISFPPLQPWSGVQLHLGHKSVGIKHLPAGQVNQSYSGHVSQHQPGHSVWVRSAACWSGPSNLGHISQHQPGHSVLVR